MNDHTTHDSNSQDWPADGHPIFISDRFGHVSPSTQVDDALGEPRRLSPGAHVRADAGTEEFTTPWAPLLTEKPTDPDRWEYSVETSPLPGEHEVTTPLPLADALERVRVTPGARLRRRPVGEWRIAPTPFPSLEKEGWSELESEKTAWHSAVREFPPSPPGILGMMGGADNTPDGWIALARRAAAAGFTPQSYRILGTALLAWPAWEGAVQRAGRGGLPPLRAIEVWALFPSLLAEGHSPLSAVRRIAVKL